MQFKTVNGLLLSILLLSGSDLCATKQYKKDKQNQNNSEVLIKTAAVCAGIAACICGAIYLEKQHDFFSNCWRSFSNWLSERELNDYLSSVRSNIKYLNWEVAQEIKNNNFLKAQVAIYKMRDWEDIIIRNGKSVENISDKWLERLAEVMQKFSSNQINAEAVYDGIKFKDVVGVAKTVVSELSNT